MFTNDKIGLLYSTATGVVLRTINPGHNEQRHLAWVLQNLPEGTSLLLLDKVAIGADDKNCPNLDVLIPYASENHGISLSFGVSCVVVDPTNTVVEKVLCCPVLYKNKLSNDALTVNHLLIQKTGEKGDAYDHLTQTFTGPDAKKIGGGL